MSRPSLAILLLVLFVTLPCSCSSAESSGLATVRHDLNVVVEPDRGRITVEDSITLPPGRPSELTFLLHEGMDPITPTPGVRLEKTAESTGDVPVEAFRLTLPPHITKFVLRYSGVIEHPLESAGRETARGFMTTPGTISAEGVFLAGSSYWYARFPADFVTFTLEAAVPQGWDVVSQGSRTLHGRRETGTYARWESPEPQDEIYLLANRFTEYAKPAGGALAMVFLRSADKALADKYLGATVQYLSMYDKLIGPYPYKKFALVENFWETGYGMPSFTLLGPTVIRLPFIINSSYPHEILHNWWGNSVYPDWEKGNWSEGLTAYLSDHLIKEQQGSGAEYRQTTLQKYADYVLSGRDFPLTDFRSRHSSPSEAIGYGKSLLFFHMLRHELGDKAFITGLREFYRDFRFKYASFDDLRKSFETASGRSLKPEFDQWVTRAGAPELRLEKVAERRRGTRYFLTARIRQIQPGTPYHLRIPIAVTLGNAEQAFQTVVEMIRADQEIMIRLPARPLRIDIDPEFDVFRRLDRNEIPPAITRALGARKMLIILPSSASEGLRSAYRGIAKAIAGSGPDEVDVKADSDVTALPTDRAMAILGWENRFTGQVLAALKGYDMTVSRDEVRIDRTSIRKKDHSFVFTSRYPENKDLALLFIASDGPDALPGLGRKLPHYHKYSYLAFESTEPENVAKGRWPVLNSPLTAFLPGADGKTRKVEMAKLAARKALIDMPSSFSPERMIGTAGFLASDELKGRGLGTPELDRAAEYIAKQFKEAGLAPGGDDGKSFFQVWQEQRTPTFDSSPIEGEDKMTEASSLKNVIGIIPGKKPELAGQSLVIGAHYDHLGLGWPDVRESNRGKVHPGADDNASGVAVLIELARVMKEQHTPDRTVVFVAFTGEEAGRIGSRYYVANKKRLPAKQVIGMVNLDTVGRLGNRKLLVLGGQTAKEWVHIFRGAGFVTGVEVEMVSEQLDSSDQVSFSEAGVPAVQIFSGPHPDYHRPADTADKIDATGLVKVAAVAKEVVEYLAQRPGPLTAASSPAQSGRDEHSSSRSVSLGTVPDFAYDDTGYRVSDVMPDSPAQAAGIQAGDVITAMNGGTVRGLKDFSEILKTLQPGEMVTITLTREGKQVTVSATTRAK